MSPENPGAPPWQILLVDDEPGVHEMSRLVLGDLVFDGRAVQLLSAHSQAQAREWLARVPGVALVLLDVVMETDDAGLGLVRHIREQRRDRLVQIVLRTGQPGMAPEREMVLCHEINGYCLKTDLTAQRLHSIVVSALRTYGYATAENARTGRDPVPATSALLRAELERAPAGELVVWQAQPEITLATNRVAGIELVPLWNTTLGLLPAATVFDSLPDPVARRPHALQLVRQACAWARAWRTGHGAALSVSVPMCGECLVDAATIDALCDAVREAALPRGALDLLLGETGLLRAGAAAQPALARLRTHGVSVTLLDVGAGMISLPRLAGVNPDRLKIHRLFVRDVTADVERMALARSVIALAHTLRIVAIADGIAGDSDAQFFRWESCQLGQGDALAPACTPSEVPRLLQSDEQGTGNASGFGKPAAS